MIGVVCLRRYCKAQGIQHPAIDEFCKCMSELAVAGDVPKWNEGASKISITGLGDDLPADLVHKDLINKITCFIREISATPMYSVHNAAETSAFLERVAGLTGMSLKDISFRVFGEHNPGRDGWGQPISLELFREWRNVI